MGWRIEFTASAERALRKLDPRVTRRLFAFLRERATADPRSHGKALQGDRVGYWRYRIGDYRVICHLEDQRLRVLVVRVAHRREIYRK